MKKILLALALAIFAASSAFAAGTVEKFGNPYINYDSRGFPVSKVVTLKLTHHTDNSLSVPFDSEIMSVLSEAKYVLKLKVIPAGVLAAYPGTTTTDAVDLELTDSDGLSLLGANGTNLVDSATTQATYFYNTFLGVPEYGYPIKNETITASTTGNDVASSVFYLKFYLVP